MGYMVFVLGSAEGFSRMFITRKSAGMVTKYVRTFLYKIKPYLHIFINLISKVKHDIAILLTYFYCSDNDILDWGKKDFLVAGLGDQVFMLDSSSNHVFKLHTFDLADTILVVKWDPEGRFIAVSAYY